MALEAAVQTADPGRVLSSLKIRDFEISAATVLREAVDIETMVQLRPQLRGASDAGPAVWWEFTISTCASDEKTLRENCHGLISIVYESNRPEVELERREELDATVTEQ